MWVREGYGECVYLLFSPGLATGVVGERRSGGERGIGKVCAIYCSPLPWPSYRWCSWCVPDSAIVVVLEMELGGGVLLSASRSRGLPVVEVSPWGRPDPSKPPGTHGWQSLM